MANSPQHDPDHEQQWDQQVLDWLDGTPDPAQIESIARHVQHCACCQQRVSEFRELDRLLVAAVPALSLDANFDGRLLAQLIPVDEQQRATARRRIARETEADLATLTHRWHRCVLLVMPGILAGVVTAVMLAEWLGGSSVFWGWLQQAAAQLDLRIVGGQTILTVLVGATVSTAVSGWLSSLVD